MKPDKSVQLIPLLFLLCVCFSGCAQKVASRFTVITDPPNAQIYSDGEFVGLSPVDIRCMRDMASSIAKRTIQVYSPKEVKAVKKGYRPMIKSIQSLDDVDEASATDTLFTAINDTSGKDGFSPFAVVGNRFPLIKMELQKEDALGQPEEPVTPLTSGNTIEREMKASSSSLSSARSAQAIATKLQLGRYYALVIGNNRYSLLKQLVTAERDARAVGKILQEEYGFEVETLTNATRSEIISSLSLYRKKMSSHDNLLIFYAGHGYLDETTQVGYWLPVDSSAENPANWLSNSTLTDLVKALPANHVFIVSDSCFSGTLVRGIGSDLLHQTYDMKYWNRIANKRARVVLASGGLEPVTDSGSVASSHHSVFAEALLAVLEENEGLLDSSQLSDNIRKKVILNADQTPEYSNLRMAGHDGGEFIFFKHQVP